MDALLPPDYAGLALLIRARLRDLPQAFALDGLVSALGFAALVTVEQHSLMHDLTLAVLDRALRKPR